MRPINARDHLPKTFRGSNNSVVENRIERGIWAWWDCSLQISFSSTLKLKT